MYSVKMFINIGKFTVVVHVYGGKEISGSEAMIVFVEIEDVVGWLFILGIDELMDVFATWR